METVTGPNKSREQELVRLVDQRQTALLRMCYLYLHDAALAEDAVQETYLKAYKAMPTFRRDCREKTWLMRIAVNTCWDPSSFGKMAAAKLVCQNHSRRERHHWTHLFLSVVGFAKLSASLLACLYCTGKKRF